MKRREVLRMAGGLAVSAMAFGAVRPATAATKARLGHVFAANSPVDQASQAFAKLIAERSNGEIEIAVYPDSQLGGDESLGRDLARGSLEFAFLNPGSLTGLDPLLDIHYLPYIATNFSDVDALFYNPGGVLQTALRETLLKHRMETLGFFELEFRAVTNSRHAVKTLADMKGLRLRVPGSSAIRSFFDAAGSQPVTMPFPELFTALQQQTVDGQDNGASITYNSRLYEAQKFMTLTNHVYAMGTIVVGERFWQRLDDAQRDLVRSTAEEVAAEEIRKNRELNGTFLQKIAEGGVEVTQLEPAEMAAFETLGRSLWDGFAAVYGAERIAALRQEVDAVKAG